MREKGNTRATGRVSDQIREEIIDALLGSGMLQFNDIFLFVVEALKKKGFSTGGEEILKLRIYEKLQMLVSLGALGKRGKEYTELPKLADVKGIVEEPRKFI